MRLEQIAAAAESYAASVEDSVRRAKTDRGHQRRLEAEWTRLKEEWRKHAGGRETTVTATGLEIPLLALPQVDHPAEIARYLGEWGFPGEFPYGASIYRQAFLRGDGDDSGREEITRMFAGFGSPRLTNQRFRFLARNQKTPRLSTAFDTMTLLGRDCDDPAYWFDIGEGGVNVCTYQDVLTLYDGFLDENVSISMTINGPSVWMTAARLKAAQRAGNDLRKVRGTSQTDPCKEDDAQNELVFPLDKSIKIAIDMFEWCAKNAPRYYPINVSGYHIEQKGATPVQQAAFTLANFFLYVDEALKRGIGIDEIPPRLPIFLTSGADIEYVALLSAVRRVAAIALRDVYGAKDPNAWKIKAHMQTSGRSLYERAPLNNITRTAIQLFYALLNVPQSLHANSWDEPITTPTEGPVTIAAHQQAILMEEIGGFKDMMMFLGDGSSRYWIYRKNIDGIVDCFRQIGSYGGVLEAKDEGFFRGKIAEASQTYEEQVLSGKRRIVGVNVYEGDDEDADVPRTSIANEVKREKADAVRKFKESRDKEQVQAAIDELKHAARTGGNVFAATYRHVDLVTLGEWSRALQDVFGAYRRRF